MVPEGSRCRSRGWAGDIQLLVGTFRCSETHNSSCKGHKLPSPPPALEIKVKSRGKNLSLQLGFQKSLETVKTERSKAGLQKDEVL